jgi:HK97 family phage portal protein
MFDKWRLKLVEAITGDTEYGSATAVVMGRSQRDTKERPKADHKKLETVYRGDPIVAAGIDYNVSFTVGSDVKFRVFDPADMGADVVNEDLDRILRRSKPNNLLRQIAKDMMVYGNAYVELIEIGGKIVRLQNVNPYKMVVKREINGDVTEYIQEIGDNESDYPHWTPDRMIHFKNREITGKPYGISDIEPILEDAEILRDMGMDLANFISNKAYPPIVWKLGTSDKPWGRADVEKWGKKREEPGPGDQISVSGDIEAEVVGVAKQTLDISSYLEFYAASIISGLRIPSAVISIINDLSPFIGEQQKYAHRRRINDLQSYIAEKLEVEGFDEIIAVNGYGKIRVEVVWSLHDDEDERKRVNNIIQLVQNGVITINEARVQAGFPEVPDGVLPQSVDEPEGTPSREPIESGDNKSTDGIDDDGRGGSVRVGDS